MRKLFHLRPRKVLRFLLFFLFSVCIVWALWVLNGIFTIRTVYISGAPVWVQIDERAIVKNLLFFPSKKLESELLSSYVLLKDVRITKQFPDTLHIEFVARSPFVKLTTGQGTVLVDKDGVVLGPDDPQVSLPRVYHTGLSLPPVGAVQFDAAFTQSLLFLNSADSLKISYITISGSEFLQAKVENTNIFIPQSGDMGTKAATLQTLWSGFRIKGTLPATIDLRFEKPIVTF